MNGVHTFHFCYLITVLALDIKLICLPMGTKCRIQVFYVCLVDLQSICPKYELEKWSSPSNNIRKCLKDMQPRWTKNAFWNVYNKKWPKWCKYISRSVSNKTHCLPALTMGSKCPNQEFYVWLVYLQTICAK
jgi:hypothetical protein